MLYVSARWSNYHALKSHSSSAVHDTAEEANRCCLTSSDRIIAFDNLQDAESYVEALDVLCEAAWTPNQSLEEQFENGIRIEQAQNILDALKGKAIELMNPWEE